jgi:hypothetical protein
VVMNLCPSHRATSEVGTPSLLGFVDRSDQESCHGYLAQRGGSLWGCQHRIPVDDDDLLVNGEHASVAVDETGMASDCEGGADRLPVAAQRRGQSHNKARRANG